MTHKEKYNDTATVDVIIPAYRPGREFGELLHRLEVKVQIPGYSGDNNFSGNGAAA